MRGDTFFRSLGTCTLGFFFIPLGSEVVPPLQGSINVYLRLTQGLRPGLCRSIALAGLIAYRSNSLSIICRSNYCICCLVSLLGDVVVCVCCRIGCSVSLFALAVGFIGRCRYLRLLSDWLFGTGVSAFRHDTPAKPRV